MSTPPTHQIDTSAVDAIVGQFATPEGNLIGILHAVQDRYSYLPEEALVRVAEQTGFSLERIYAIATFYNHFSLEPRGRHLVRVCMGTACHVQGASRVMDELSQQLGCSEGHTSEDMQFTLESVRCVGACSLAPVVVIGDDTHACVHPKKVKHLLKPYRKDTGAESREPS
jgi:NADH:ubiquinone oxidoreductase subunit E